VLAAFVAIFQLAAAPVPAPLQGPGGEPRTYSGVDRQLEIALPRIEAVVRIDGVLDEPVWAEAALLTRFSQYEPNDERPAEDSTQVLVWYSPGAIHFGVRAYESHGGVNATLADRDRIDSDDYVQLFIDTFNDHRQAHLFGVNPRGVQSDGIRSESQEVRSGGLGSASARPAPKDDLTPDFVYDSRGRVTDYGYEVEIRIPFKSITYQSKEPQDWGIHVLRKVQHSGHVNSWTPALRNETSFLAQAGTLAGLTALHRGIVVDLNPSVTGKLNGAPGPVASPEWGYGNVSPDFGASARISFSTNMALAATVNPDFSQVESDIGLITSNQRFAQFVAEKRPFFLDGIEKFETPNTLIYTRKIIDPVAGVKFAGKTKGTNIGFLSSLDSDLGSLNGSKNPIINMLRVRRDIGKQSTLGVVYTDRIDGDDFNRVAALDTRLAFAKQYYVQLQAGGSHSRVAGNTTTAPLLEAILNRAGRRLTMNYKLSAIGTEFFTAAGFVPRTNIVHGNLSTRVLFPGKRGNTIENWSIGLTPQAWWAYDGLGELPVESKLSMNNQFTLKGGWVGSVSVGWETYAFDAARYTTYYKAPAGGGEPEKIVFPDRINDVAGVIVRFSTPEFERVSASIGFNRWQDVGFAEAVPVWLFRGNAELNWRPTDQVRVQALYSSLRLDRRYDGSRLAAQSIPRLKVEYQISRPIFVRFVGQYNSNEQEALRDPTTHAPILVRSSTGVFRPSTRTLSNGFRTDWLFSYQPTPGTVIFAGYGSTMTEPETFRFSNLERQTDGFFVKLSYLFRR
jgi:hypothetical protein